MALISTTQGQSFHLNESESILDAASKSGISLPYSCRTGRCSSCKCKVIRGESMALQDELGLSAQEKAAGWILSCVRTAISDLEIDVEDLGGMLLPSIKTLPCRIHALEKLAPDVVKVMLRLPPNSEFAFHPGQYIDVIGHGGLRRSYSLANANANNKQLELHIRAVHGGAMSNYWFGHAKENDLLRLNGPLGTFFLRSVADLDLIFLATGTGIAPVKAMLEGIAALTDDRRPRSTTVYWGGRTAQDLYWDVSSISAAHRYAPVLSRPNTDWCGARGYVQDALIANRPNLGDAVVYACGSDAMIRSAHALLVDAGLPERRFYSDAFVCSAVN